MLIISCDPGLTGAVALLDSKRGLLECEDIPTCANGTASGSMRNWVDAERLQSTEVMDIARLANLRMWEAYHQRDTAKQASQETRS